MKFKDKNGEITIFGYILIFGAINIITMILETIF